MVNHFMGSAASLLSLRVAEVAPFRPLWAPQTTRPGVYPPIHRGTQAVNWREHWLIHTVCKVFQSGLLAVPAFWRGDCTAPLKRTIRERGTDIHSIAWWPTLIVVSVATVTDLRSRRIPNWLVLPFMVAGIVVSS